jgi:hypothetical protein
MRKSVDVRIDVEAAKALVYWKSLFAEEVAAREAARCQVERAGPCHLVALPSGCAGCSSLTPGGDLESGAIR